MSKILIGAITLLFISSCVNMFNKLDSSREKKIFYSADGENKYETEYLNGKPDGISKTLDRDGNLIGETDYVNGLIHGFMIKYFENGEKMYECEYLYGQKHGQEIFFYNDGSIKRVLSYEYGVQKSIKRYNKDGKFRYE